ncbi:MAG: NnrU family protein [Candidatus Binatia bacterium]
MEPVFAVTITWLVFGLTHVGLATLGIRSRLVARLGEQGFAYFFSGIAAVAFTLVVATYAGARFEGPPGPGLGQVPIVREALIALVVVGVVLMTATFAGYHEGPYEAGVVDRRFPPPRGLERVTRHAFFVGLVIFSVAHALLATKLVGAVFLLGNAAVAAIGAWHQDRKLLSRFGEPFAAYLRETSAVPFGAILFGRQRLVWNELPFAAIAAGLALAWGLRSIHEWIFVYGGLGFVAAVLAGVVIIGAVTLRREAARRRVRRDGFATVS